MDTTCKYSVGQIIHHLRFDYRGVIVDLDATFQGTEEWYLEMAKSKPPRDKPWYHVLVDQSFTMTYVAERNLEADPSPKERRVFRQFIQAKTFERFLRSKNTYELF